MLYKLVLNSYPPLGCNGSALKRGVGIEVTIEHVYDNDDDDNNDNSNKNIFQ